MPETSTAELPQTEIFKPIGTEHEIANPASLQGLSINLEQRNGAMPLAQYMMKEGGKPRGSKGGRDDLNSHTEQFIVKEGDKIAVKNLEELRETLRLMGLNVDILGIDSVGNPFQTVTATVQGINPEDPNSGYERPTVAEGPHMIIAPYAYDKDGNLHIFRTIQQRPGDISEDEKNPKSNVSVDTPRGFMDAETLQAGQHIYKAEGSEKQVNDNLKRIVKEEGGEKLLQIKRVSFLGSHVVNKSFVTSPSALFAVEIDYEEFIKLKDVVDKKELQRRQEQESHEGLSTIMLDMTLEEYLHYRSDPNIMRDMAADAPADIIVMQHLHTLSKKLQPS